MSVGNVHRKHWVGTNPAHVSVWVSEVSGSGWEGNCWLQLLAATRQSLTGMKWKHKAFSVYPLLSLSCKQYLQSQQWVFSQWELYWLHNLIAWPLQPWLYLLSGKNRATGDARLCSHLCYWSGVSPVRRRYWESCSLAGYGGTDRADTYRRVRVPVIIVFIFLTLLRVRRQLHYKEYFYTDTFCGFPLSESELTCWFKYQF